MKIILKSYIIILIITTIFISSLIASVSAGECEYGSLYAWFKGEDGKWENATAHPTLKLGEEFEIKATVTAEINLLAMSMKLHEFGTPVYEVIEGPSEMEKTTFVMEPKKDDFNTTTWKLRVRPNTTWVNGYGPLEILSQFTKNDDESCIVSFNVIAAYIEDELWEGYTPDEGGPNGTNGDTGGTSGTPGFEILLVLLAISGILFMRRKLQ